MLTTTMMPTRTPVMPRKPSSHQELSSLRVLTGPENFNFSPVSPLTLEFASKLNLTIRMGGGPRTFPGGVSKWQWKRMQDKKAKQFLKARLLRERQTYEMRKRAELKTAISELERPWEVVEKAPTLFSVKADEQVKVLADRFQKPGGFDMWSEKDGPQVFQTPDGLPSARFFPKNAVYSVKPYGVVDTSDSARPTTTLDKEMSTLSDWTARANGGKSISKRPDPNRKGDIEIRRSTGSGKDTQGKVTNKGMNVYRKLHHDNNYKGKRFSDDSSYRSSTFIQSKEMSNLSDWTARGNGGKGRSRRLDLNREGDIEIRRSTSSVDGTHGEVTNKDVNVYRKSHHDNDHKGKTFDDSSSRSSTFIQRTLRPGTRQGARRNLNDQSTRKAHVVKDYKPQC